MADRNESDTYPGDLTPGQLAERLGWPVELVLERIEDGRISSTPAGWTVSTSSEIREEWAKAHWAECSEENGSDRNSGSGISGSGNSGSGNSGSGNGGDTP